MANQGAKKRKEGNARHMARLRQVIIASNGDPLSESSICFLRQHWIGLAVTSVAYIVPYQQLADMATPMLIMVNY